MKNSLMFIKRNIVFFIILLVTIIYIASNNVDFFGKSSVKVDGDNLSTFSVNSNPIINSSFDNTFYSTTDIDTKLINYKGEEKWAYSTLYQSPKTAFSGEYLAVWDNKGNGNIVVFNKKGFVYEIANNNKLLDVDINKNGYVAVLFKDTDNVGSVVKIYNVKGENLATRICDDENTFAISVSICDDNRIFGLSEIDTNYLQPRSLVTLSYINQNDNKKEDKVFFGTTYKDEVVAKVDFKNNYLIAYSADNIHINAIANDVAKEVGTIALNNEVEFMEVVDNKYICVAFGNAKNSLATKSNTVVFYNFDGKLISQRTLDSKITGMTSAENSVIITSNRKIGRLTTNCAEKFVYQHNKDIYGAYYIGNKKSAILVESDKIISLSK